MADDVTPLFKSKKECIETAQSLLRAVKEGEVTGFIAMTMDPNGDTQVAWGGDFSLTEMAGALAIASAQVIQAATVEAEAPPSG